MNFTPQIALNYARHYSRPRKVGTREEKQVAQEIAIKLEEIGYVVDVQDFRFSTAFDRFLVVEILGGLLMISGSILLAGINRWFTLIPTGLLIILLLLINPINRFVRRNSFDPVAEGGSPTWSKACWKFGDHYRVKNIVATLPSFEAGEHHPHLYLVAHYDSKSQYIPLIIRITLFVLLIVGSIIFAVFSLLNYLTGTLTMMVIVSGVLVICWGLPLMFLGSGDDSPGAIDNASGVGLVLHLAEIIANHPELNRKLGLTVLLTSAEELGVMGALAYVQQNDIFLHGRVEQGGLCVLNFDGIGVDGKLYMVGREPNPTQANRTDLHHLVKQSAAEFGIPLGRFFLPGAMFDHIPFAEEGYDALSLIAVGKGSGSIHTAGDSPEKLHIKGFDQAGRLALRVVEKFCGEQFNPE